MQKLVSENYKVPQILETENFVLKPLTVNDLVKDYAAVISSVDHLQGVFGERSSWPSSELSLEQDIIDLGWHQKEFQRKTSFAYSVMTPDLQTYLGCVYIFPSEKEAYEVEIYLWVTEQAFKEGIDSVLYGVVRSWIADKWPFTRVAYPGRDIDWDAWSCLK